MWKTSNHLLEFNVFEVKQVNKKKKTLINAKNYNTDNKNILKLKKTVVSNSNDNVKEPSKKYDILKT